MAKRKHAPWVIMPYEDLEDLYDAAQEIKRLKHENKRLQEQLNALRTIQQECLEKIREIKRCL